MNLCKVTGNITASVIADGIEGSRYLLVENCSPAGDSRGEVIVAIDLIGAAIDELVLVSQGSSTRQTDITKDKPVDAAIIGIVDIVEEDGKVVYKK